MSSIQSSINSMIGSASGAIRAVKGFQALKAKQSMPSANNASNTASIKPDNTDQANNNNNNNNMAVSSPQEQAAILARQHSEDEMIAKQRQRESWEKHIAAYNRGDYDKLSPKIKENIKAGIEKYQQENKNGLN